MKKMLSLVVIGTAAAAVLTATTASAWAYDPAYNERDQYIASSPTTDAKTCINRHIYLADDWYTWEISGLESGATERDIKLTAGWYQWQDCLAYSSPGDYVQTSQLDPDDPAQATASQFNWDYSTGKTYLWGSWLIPA